MPVLDLFSKRKKRALQGNQADVYQYDMIPQPLRVQIAHIWRDAIGNCDLSYVFGADGRWKWLHDAIAREKGVFQLEQNGNFDQRCVRWFLKSDTDDALDMIELTFRYIDRMIRQYHPSSLETQYAINIKPDDAILELNERFQEHCVGYQFDGGVLLRTDSQFIHSEVVKPALMLLRSSPFEKANEEFLLAHQHYREGKYQDSVVAAQRSFESALKAICALKKWPFNKGDRVSDLIKAVRANGLFPDYLDAGFDSFVATMKTGLPGVRNNAGGHGQEPSAPAIPSYVAAFALHMTAANIVMVVEASEVQRSRRRT